MHICGARLHSRVAWRPSAPVAALAQGTGVPPTDLHRYPLPTYEEDWRALQRSDRTDVWDPIKFVPLSADGAISLSLGAEARVTYERFGHQNFGLTPPDPDGYLLQRYLLHTDVHVGSRARVWTEFNSSFENGRIGGPRPVIDEDKLDLHQAFVDVTVGVTGPSAAVLRVGRQEIALGAGRMYPLRLQRTVRGAVGPCHSDDELRVALGDLSVLKEAVVLQVRSRHPRRVERPDQRTLVQRAIDLFSQSATDGSGSFDWP